MSKPVKIQSWTTTTKRLNLADQASGSTANLEVQGFVIKSVGKPVTVNEMKSLDLRKVNRALRGHRETVRVTMDQLVERETA